MAKKHGCLFSFVAFVLVIVVVCGAGIWLLLNNTPRSLNLANVKINNYTLEQLGIADVTLGEVVTFAKSLTTEHSQSEIAPEAYTAADKKAADDKFQNTKIALLGKIQYKNLLYMSAQSTTLDPLAQPLVLGYGEVAYVVDSALHQFYNSTEANVLEEGVEAIMVLKLLDASVVQTTFSLQNSQIFLTSVLRLNIAEYVSDLNKQLPFGLRIADTLFCTLTNQIKIDDTGKITNEGFVSVVINDQDAEMSEIVLNALFMLIAEEGSEPLSCEKIDGYVCIVESILCGHVGGIGTKNEFSVNTYGSNGIDFETQKITFLPNADLIVL